MNETLEQYKSQTEKFIKNWINGALFDVCEWEKLCQVVLMCDHNEIMKFRKWVTRNGENYTQLITFFLQRHFCEITF